MHLYFNSPGTTYLIAAQTITLHDCNGSLPPAPHCFRFSEAYTFPRARSPKEGGAQMSRALAKEWAARNLQVNAIAPGYCTNGKTSPLRQDRRRHRPILDRISTRRWGEPRHLAGAVSFHAAPASDSVTGTVLIIGGCGCRFRTAAPWPQMGCTTNQGG